MKKKSTVILQLDSIFLENKEYAKHYNQYLNCKILHGGDAFAALTKRIRNANEI